jgi:hypothetical protein
VAVAVAVATPVTVAALVNGNDAVAVITPANEHASNTFTMSFPFDGEERGEEPCLRA